MNSGKAGRGKAMRDKAVSVAMKRKEEYLGARVPKELRDKVIERAKAQGIPVSILIRNILMEAFKAEGGASVTSPSRVEDAATAPSTPVVTNFDDVLAWEPITLNKNVPCAGCGVELSSGMQVVLGLGSAKPVVLCGNCNK